MSRESSPSVKHIQNAPQPKPTGLWRIFFTFGMIGIQSFGGGSATFLLIHQTCMKHGWMDEDEFIKSWAICQLSPGINLIKLTILIGRKLRGFSGMLAANSGLLVPSAIITGLMTAFYTLYKDLPAIQAAMRGILPATIGLSLAMSANLAVPIFKAAKGEGKVRFVVQMVIIAGAGLALALDWLSPLWIMLAAAGLTAIALTYIPTPPPAIPESQKE